MAHAELRGGALAVWRPVTVWVMPVCGRELRAKVPVATIVRYIRNGVSSSVVDIPSTPGGTGAVPTGAATDSLDVRTQAEEMRFSVTGLALGGDGLAFALFFSRDPKVEGHGHAHTRYPSVSGRLLVFDFGSSMSPRQFRCTMRKTPVRRSTWHHFSPRISD